MTVFSVIKKSELEGAERFDAEYYQPKYLDIQKKILEKPHESLKTIAERIVSFGAYSLTSKIDWDETNGIPFFVAENVKEGFLDLENVRHITEATDEILWKSRVKEGTVLLAMSGSVGNAAVAHDIPEKLNSNQDVVKITVKKGYSPYFLAAFLNSKYGKSQVLRLPVGSVQQHIFLWQIETLLIPKFGPKHTQDIESRFLQALKEGGNSIKLYAQAEQLLLDELGIKEPDFENELSYEVDLSEAAERTDAEYFQPKYQKLKKIIEKYGSKPLTELVQNVKADFNPAVQANESFKYVELANINSGIGVIDGSSGILGSEAPSRAKRILKPGDVIVSSVEGSLEKVALVDETQEGYLASTGFFQFCSDKILPEVLLVLTKSPILQMQLKQQTAGTILTAVPKDALQKIVLPLLPRKLQSEIADLIKKSHTARHKSKQLLESAKHQVEQIVEKP